MIFPSRALQAAAAAKLSEVEFFVLAYLVQEAREESGWLRRSVRGWHFSSEIEVVLGVRQIHELLFRLKRKALLDTIGLQDVSARHNLYRANDLSAQVVDLALGREDAPLHAPALQDTALDARLVFMRLESWAALSALRDAKDRKEFEERWGERGWLTAREIKRCLGADVSIDTEYLYWLESRGMVEKRRTVVDPDRPQRPGVCWKVTELGERTRVIDDYGILAGLAPLLQVEIVEGGPPPFRYARRLSELLLRQEWVLRHTASLLPRRLGELDPE